MPGDSLGLLASPRSFRAFGRLIARWWREPVDYGAQVQYYTKRSLADAIRAMIVVGLALFALIATGLAFLARDADMPTAAIMVLFAALTAYWSIAWWRNPWPSRRRSATFVVSLDSTIVLLLVMSTDWETGIYGLSCFALLAIYLMFFDGAKALAAHTVWMVIAAVDLVVDQLVVAHADTQLTAILVLLATLPVLVSPLGIQLSIWALRGDADASVHDPLTGLLNRRGLQLQLTAWRRVASLHLFQQGLYCRAVQIARNVLHSNHAQIVLTGAGLTQRRRQFVLVMRLVIESECRT